RSFPFKIDTPGKILSQKIHHALLDLPETYIEEYRKNITAVSAENIAQRIEDHFSKDDLVISVLGSKESTLQQIQQQIQPDQTIVVDYQSLITS
ncbi:MAG: hypothetical protein KDK51_11170, partial [Deltaproteobacteria bacterium]|nr:hypothetical protein [Deltaproteobacteria bacterium]